MQVSDRTTAKSGAALKKAAPVTSKKKYPTGKLLKSSALAGYQPDFARVILTEPEYSIGEAKRLLDNVLKGGK